MTTFRADHVGSLLRPQALLDARAAHAAGRLDGDGLRAAEDAAIRSAIAMQEAAAGRTLAIHLCRGNSRSRWMHEGGYDRIAEKLLHSLDFDTLLLEYDDERSGGFEPLRFVPPDKVVVLGLVSTKGPELEDGEALTRRIEEAARHMPIERLALSPQCGFASVASGNLLTEDDQRRKLELIAATAARVWG